jgi:hypothetical protein
MAQVENWRSEHPYIVLVRPHPTLGDQWVLELPSGAMLTAPVRFDDDADPVFSPPKNELLVHVALRECDPSDVDFRLLSDGGLEISGQCCGR